ncbi:MAG TPA: hypothetical protein HPP80_00535 [Rhodospirillaceae bacterium]|nr:hypothetical protein [Rhodospirillaceae bacterium]
MAKSHELKNHHTSAATPSMLCFQYRNSRQHRRVEKRMPKHSLASSLIILSLAMPAYAQTAPKAIEPARPAASAVPQPQISQMETEDQLKQKHKEQWEELKARQKDQQAKLRAQQKDQHDKQKAMDKDQRDKLKAEHKQQRDKLRAEQRERYQKLRDSQAGGAPVPSR